MIRLTRLRNSNPLYVNPDHIERLDQFHETTVHLFNGDEFVVTETAEEIVELITLQRAKILAVASRLAAQARHEDETDAEGGLAQLAGVAEVADTGTGSVTSVVGLLDNTEEGKA